jgi:hypothetical protein
LLVLNLTFSDPLYVSSTTQRDTLSITILGNRLFLASSDLYQLAKNYRIPFIEVPPQMASAEDFEQVSTMGSAASNSMIMTLVIPLCFMVFMSASLDRVWSLYNMLQILSNMKNMLTMSIPANAYLIITVIKNISFFSVLQE